MAHRANGSALEVRDLAFSYPDQAHVLRSVDLRVAPGERVGLIGPNGAGKTTLFCLACGVLKPDAGAVRLFGEPVRPGGFHPQVGLVFQNPDDQLFSPSVRDDVAFGPTNMGLSPDGHRRAGRPPAAPPLGRREADGLNRGRARHAPATGDL
jgi:cobalt/nickel transport system ATP-binding protein